MGTITRTFANNITTSGVFKPTAFNNASFDNVTSVPSGAVEGGNMVLLSTQTASGDASISFTTGIDSTYKEYMFILNNIHPSASYTGFGFNLSTDNGSNYNVVKTSTAFSTIHDEADTETFLGYRVNEDLAQSSSRQPLDSGISGISADEGLSGYIKLFNPSDTTYVKHYMSRTSNVKDVPGAVDHYTGGYANTTSAINAIQFAMASGNIEAGTIQMFGIL